MRNRRTPLGGQVGNLVLKLPGTVRGPRRMLSAHVDTVPICVGSRPVRKGKYVVSANKKTGLGADDRAGAAVLLTTVLAILRGEAAASAADVSVDREEEVGLFGARYVQARRSSASRSWRSTSTAARRPMLTIGATGGYRMTIEIEGLASHAGNRPEEGVSAIAIASLAIADLVQERLARADREGWHAGTSNVGVIHGGDATNVVTDHVRIRAEARSHDPKFRERIVKEIEAAFKRAAAAVRNTAGKCGTRDVRRPARLRIVSPQPRRAVRRRRPRRRSRPKGCEPELARHQRRAGRQLAHGPRHSDRHARLRPAEYPHGGRGTRYRRVSAGPPDRTSPSHGGRFAVV